MNHTAQKRQKGVNKDNTERKYIVFDETDDRLLIDFCNLLGHKSGAAIKEVLRSFLARNNITELYEGSDFTKPLYDRSLILSLVAYDSGKSTGGTPLEAQKRLSWKSTRTRASATGTKARPVTKKTPIVPFEPESEPCQISDIIYDYDLEDDDEEYAINPNFADFGEEI